MKLLLIADRFDRSALCEASWWTEALAQHAVHRGWRVEAVCTDPTSAGPDGVSLWRHGPRGMESALVDALAGRPDLLYVATPGPLAPRLVDAIARGPLLLDVMSHWPICPHDDHMFRPAFRRCEMRYPADACGPCAGLERLRDMETRLKLVRTAASVIVHARFQSERLTGLLERPLETLTLGVDVEHFSTSPAAPQGEAAGRLVASRGMRPRVVLLGPPTQARGLGVLLDIIIGVRARIADAEFVIAGHDPANPAWQAALGHEAKELGLGEHVHLLGPVDPADWPAVIASSDVGIAPGLWDDPCGLFVLQAFASGVPVVASGRGVHAELLQHGSGMLASPQSPAIFADRVAMLLAHREARLTMGDAARLHAVEHHDLGRSLEQVENLMLRAIGELPKAA